MLVRTSLKFQSISVPEAAQEAKRFLEGHVDTLRRFERVARLIEGFETPLGMELLSTVHWVATHETPRAGTPSDALRAVQAWSTRKARLMREEHLLAAWQRLSEEGWLRRNSLQQGCFQVVEPARIRRASAHQRPQTSNVGPLGDHRNPCEPCEVVGATGFDQRPLRPRQFQPARHPTPFRPLVGQRSPLAAQLDTTSHPICRHASTTRKPAPRSSTAPIPSASFAPTPSVC